MKYFTIKELSRTSYNLPNIPDEKSKANLINLVEKILDPLREVFGKPVYVNSGYRSAAVNRAAGGVASSQHLSGKAADIRAGSRAENKRLFILIQTLDLPFDQLIFEGGSILEGPDWVHVSYDPSRNRRQVLPPSLKIAPVNNQKS